MADITVKIKGSWENLKASLTQAASVTSASAAKMAGSVKGLESSSSSALSRLKGNLTAYAEHHKHHMTEMGNDATKFSSVFLGAFAGSAVAGAVLHFGAEIGEAAMKVAELGEELSHASEKSGIAVETMGELKYSAELSHVSFENLQGSTAKFAKALSAAETGTGPAATALKALGIETDSAAWKTASMDEKLMVIADRFHESEDGAAKASIAMALFGRGGASLIPWLNKGSEAIRAQGKEARELGVVLSKDAAEASVKLVESTKRLNAAISGVSQQILAQFIPILADMTEGLIEDIKQGGALRVSLDGLGFTVKGLASIFLGAKAVVVATGQAIGSTAYAVTTGVLSMGQAFKALVSGDFAGAKAAWAQGNQAMSATFKEMAEGVQEEIERTGKSLDLLWNKAQHPPKAQKDEGQKKKLSSIGDITAEENEEKAGAKATTKALAAERKQQAKDAAAAAKEAAGYEKAELADTVKALKAADKEKAAADRESAAMEKAEINDRVRALKEADRQAQELAREDAKIEKALAQDKIRQEKALYAGMVEPITTAFSQSAIGVMRGNQTLLGATRNMLQSVVASYGESAVKLAAKWAFGQETMTDVENLEAAKRTAIRVAEGAEALAAQAMLALKSIGNAAAEAFAWAFADTTEAGPEAVPAAPGVAAGVMAAVLAAGSSVASAAGGYDIPAGVNPIVQAHAQEMVLPAPLANKVRNMTDGGSGGRGGPTVTIHAVDAQSVQRLFAQHGSALLRTLKGQLRNFEGR